MPAPGNHSARSILLAIGVGDFNATMIIPYLFMAPAQTDPQMPQIIVMTKHLQMLMNTMGCTMPATGSIDAAWAPYFAQVVGPDWMNTTWDSVCNAVLAAKARGFSFAAAPTTMLMRSDLSGFTDSIPGGKTTLYVLGALLLYRHFKKA